MMVVDEEGIFVCLFLFREVKKQLEVDGEVMSGSWM